MDSKAVETLAVNAVRDCVVMSDNLDQYIMDNDKEPSFDGFIYLYKDGGKTKRNFIGRIAVQIKGTQAPRHSKDGVKYPIETVDLRTFLQEGGGIFFVVYISKSGLSRSIHYIDLLPSRINNILKSNKDKATVTIKLKPLPADPNRVFILLNSFYDHKKMQSVIGDLKQLPSIDDLQTRGVLKEINLTVLNTGSYCNPIDAFLHEDVYVYAKTTGNDVNIPIGIITETKERVVSHTEERSITIGGKLFYDKYVIANYTEKDVFRFGQCVSITAPHLNSISNEEKTTITYSPCSSLRSRAHDLDFWLSLIDAGGFNINNSFFECHVKSLFPLESFERAKAERDLLSKTIEAFNILHISDDLDLTQLTLDDWQQIKLLIGAFVEKQTILDLRQDLPYSYLLTIGDIHIALCHTCNNGIPLLFDFFDSQYMYKFTIEKVEHFAPSYATLNEDMFRKISNIPYNDILPSYMRMYTKYHDSTLFPIANNTLLAILLAYDCTHKKVLIDVAIALSSWILDTCPEDEMQLDIRLINSFQTIKRIQTLGKEDRERLIAIAEDSKAEERIRVGAYLLLDNQEAAALHFNRMSDKLQNTFRTWPIYKFWTHQ